MSSSKQKLIEFGNVVKKIRWNRKEFQKEMAKKLKMTPSTLAKIENGKKAPQPNFLNKVKSAYVLNVMEQIELYNTLLLYLIATYEIAIPNNNIINTIILKNKEEQNEQELLVRYGKTVEKIRLRRNETPSQMRDNLYLGDVILRLIERGKYKPPQYFNGLLKNTYNLTEKERLELDTALLEYLIVLYGIERIKKENGQEREEEQKWKRY